MKTIKVRPRPGGPVMEVPAEAGKTLIDAGLFVPESEKDEPAPSPRKRPVKP